MRPNQPSLRGGTRHEAAGSAVTTLQAGDTAGVRLSAGAWRADEFSTAQLPAYTAPYDTTPHQYAVSADSRIKLSPTTQLTAEGTASSATSFEVAPLPVFDTGRYRTYSGKVGLSADTAFGILNVQVYRNQSEYIVSSVSSTVDVVDNVDVLQASDLLKLGTAHSVRTGFEYRNNSATGISIERSGYQLYAPSALWIWQLAPDLLLANSVRIDHLRLDFPGSLYPLSPFSAADYDHGRLTAVSFDSGLVFSPSELQTVRLMVARGVQAPSLLDLNSQYEFHYSGYSFGYFGNPNLKPMYKDTGSPHSRTLRMSAWSRSVRFR